MKNLILLFMMLLISLSSCGQTDEAKIKQLETKLELLEMRVLTLEHTAEAYQHIFETSFAEAMEDIVHAIHINGLNIAGVVRLLKGLPTIVPNVIDYDRFAENEDGSFTKRPSPVKHIDIDNLK